MIVKTVRTQEDKSSLAVSTLSVDLLNDFFAYLDVAPKTLQAYQKSLRQVFRYFSEQGISRPCQQDIINFKRGLEAKKRKPSTIALYLSACRRFFSWTEQRGIFPNIANGVKAPRQERGHKRDFFGAEQLKQILSGMKRLSLKQKRDFAIMAVLSSCGLRTIELSRANIEDVRNVGGQMLFYVQGKGRKEKTEFVKLPEPVYQAISDYLSARGGMKDDEPLFASIGNRNQGGRMTTRTISMIAKTAMRKSGYNSSRLSAHSLRHSAVTIALLQGNSIQDVQAFARHANINTTEIYSHAVDRMRSTCETSIAHLIF